MELKNKYRLLASVLSLLFIAIALFGWFIAGDVTLIIALGVLLGLLLLVQVESHQRIQQATQQLLQQQKVILQQQNEISQHYQQIESLFSIFQCLKITHPLPTMRGWVISPDFAKTLVDLVLETKPKLILEASSGVSTILASYCLKQLGEGKLIALEEQSKYAEASCKELVKHGLEDVASVIHASLKEIEIAGKKWLWYDKAKLEGIKQIDMLVIDGPAQAGQDEEMIRYPALPLLFDLLSDRAIILLDDADRQDERKIVELWLEQFDCFELEKVKSEKGTVILRRIPATQT